MLSRRKRTLTLASLLILVLLLSGCTSGIDTKPTAELAEGSFWEKYIVFPVSWSLENFADLFFGEYALAILAVTIIIRLIVLPLTLKSYRSNKEMQKLQPEMKALKEKYKDDPKKQQEETIRLFQTHGVNPMAGCFPMLVQMPILIALYNAIVWNQEIRDHNFLWMDLGDKDPFYILPVIAAITTWIQQKMMMTTQQNNPMQALMFIFPVMIFIMSMSFPAALPLYWIYGNIFTIVQSYFIYVKPHQAEQAQKALEAAAVKKSGKGKGGRSK